MKRRKFILLSGSALVIGIPWLGCQPRNAETLQALSSPLDLSQVCTAKEVVEIGSAYRKQVPEESEESKLVSLLLADEQGNTLSENAGILSAGLKEKSYADFAAGRTVVVNGWVLSITEARQCAVYSINHHR